MLNFVLFSSDAYMSRANISIQSINKWHPKSLIHFYKLDNVTSHTSEQLSYIEGLAKFRIEKLIELLIEHPNETFVLMGSDCVLYNHIGELKLIMSNYNIILCTHNNSPLTDNKFPSNVDVYRTGHVNADFLIVNKNSLPILQWIVKQEFKNDPSNGYFYEQTWLSAVPFLFDKVYILRDNAYNLAYFNAYQRTLTKENDNYFVDGAPLKMVQYSGYEKDKPERLSRHNGREDATGMLLELYKEYDENI